MVLERLVIVNHGVPEGYIEPRTFWIDLDDRIIGIDNNGHCFMIRALKIERGLNSRVKTKFWFIHEPSEMLFY